MVGSGKNEEFTLVTNIIYFIVIICNLYCVGKGGRLRSERGDILWEDDSPNDFSYWNNIREGLH